jgi:hypothetical protein
MVLAISVAACGGEKGSAGLQGAQGAAGATPVISQATAAQCPAGGIVVTMGSVVQPVCNGTSGTKGTNGTDPVITVQDATTCGVAGGKDVLVNGAVLTTVCNGDPTVPVFSTIPEVLPPHMWSQAFEATQTQEFGDLINLSPGTGRHAVRANVLLENFDVASYSLPITLNLYSVSDSGLTSIGSVTQSFDIPARPAGDSSCPAAAYGEPGNEWLASDGNCYQGILFKITFDLSSISTALPDSFAYGIAYNTTDWGYAPTQQWGPYDNLNVALLGDGSSAAAARPFIGSVNNPDAVLWNTKTPSNYADGGTAGVGVFRKDTGWTGFAPAVEFFAY